MIIEGFSKDWQEDDDGFLIFSCVFVIIWYTCSMKKTVFHTISLLVGGVSLLCMFSCTTMEAIFAPVMSTSSAAEEKTKQFTTEECVLASDYMAEKIEMIFPVASSEGKNASEYSDELLLNRIAGRLLSQASFTGKIPAPDQIQVAILETDELNSLSGGTGYIYITRKLLDFATDNSQKAALIAHELAHMSLGHTLAKLKTGSEDEIKSSAEDCLYFVMGHYTAKYEQEADTVTTVMLKKAGYDPDALVVVLRKIQGAGVDLSPGMDDNHPTVSQRLLKLSK